VSLYGEAIRRRESIVKIQANIRGHLARKQQPGNSRNASLSGSGERRGNDSLSRAGDSLPDGTKSVIVAGMDNPLSATLPRWLTQRNLLPLRANHTKLQKGSLMRNLPPLAANLPADSPPRKALAGGEGLVVGDVTGWDSGHPANRSQAPTPMIQGPQVKIRRGIID
jgi:hypothetical protein